jgi:hypothetical protein
VVLRFGYRDVTERPQVCRAQLVALHQQRAGMVPRVGMTGRAMPSRGTAPG